MGSCNAPVLTLCLLAVLYGAITAASVSIIFVYFQMKIDSAISECVRSQELKPSEPSPGFAEKDIVTARESNTSTSVQAPAASDLECYCLNDTDDDGLADDNMLSQQPVLLRCCSNNETILQQKVAKWTENVESGETVAILVSGSPEFQIDSRDSQRQPTIMSWTIGSDRDIGYRHNVRLDNDGSFIVPKTGYYMVYSKVAFRRSSGNQRDPSALTIGHTTAVDQEDRPKEQRLMHSARLQCESSNRPTSYSSFHSGIFKLIHHDKVYVKVTVPANARVTFESRSSMFGMYLLSIT